MDRCLPDVKAVFRRQLRRKYGDLVHAQSGAQVAAAIEADALVLMAQPILHAWIESAAFSATVSTWRSLRA